MAQHCWRGKENRHGREVERAVIVGHDWGGSVAWNVAMRRPDVTDLLIICNLPHPAGIAREITTNPQQKINSDYAFNFQKPDAHEALSVERLAQWVTDPVARQLYVQAFQQSDFEAMLTTTRPTIRNPRRHRRRPTSASRRSRRRC